MVTQHKCFQLTSIPTENFKTMKTIINTLLTLLLLTSTVFSESKESQAPRVLILVAEHEYETFDTLPELSKKYLVPSGCKVDIFIAEQKKSKYAKDKTTFPGIEKVIDKADVIILSVRRRQLPEKTMSAIRKHLDQGKGMVSIRTSVSAFQPVPAHKQDIDKLKAPEGYAKWDYFGQEVLACSYNGHGKNLAYPVSVSKEKADHPILKGLDMKQGNKIYHVLPLLRGATPLLYGKDPETGKNQPIIWTVDYGKNKAPIVVLSCGTQEDFTQQGFYTMVKNATYWAAEKSAKK